jgi:hypothetical protein
VSFELFGQFHTVVGEQPGDRDAFLAGCVRRWATQIGLTPDHAHPSAQEHDYGLEPVME